MTKFWILKDGTGEEYRLTRSDMRKSCNQVIAAGGTIARKWSYRDNAPSFRFLRATLPNGGTGDFYRGI